MIGFLAAIGDVLQVNSNFIEQLAGITSVGESVAGITATRTYTVEFRHSTDNTTWTAWTTWNLANATAITYDPNATNYFQHRFTRTGSDVTGLLEVQAILMGLTIDPSATSGHGAIVDLTMQTDLFNLFAACIQFKMPTTATNRKKVEVVNSWPQGMSLSGGLLPIYIHDLRARPSAFKQIGGGQSEFRFSMLISIKRIMQADGDTYQGSPIDQFAGGVIRRMFDATTWHVESYDITFKSVDFISQSFDYWGIVNPTLEDRGTFAADNDYFQTFSINFALNTNVVQRYGYTSIH